MKKGLLLAIGVSAGLGLAAQAPKVGGVSKPDLSLSKKSIADTRSENFYQQAANSQRNGNNPAVLAAGTKFSSSRNAFGLLVSQSTTLTANQALGAAMWTNRLSADWSVPNQSSGSVNHIWTTNNGTSWDSTYFVDFETTGNQRFRYPSGVIVNPAGNTTLANAWAVSCGPYTDGSGWQGYWTSEMNVSNSAIGNTMAYTNGNQGVFPLGMPRIGMTSTADSSVWVTGGTYTDPVGLTGFTGAAIMHGKHDGTQFNWTWDSILPNFHTDGTGAADAWTVTHIAFNQSGQIGYVVFFGADAAATTSATRTFLPLVWKTTDFGATWTRQPLFDFTTLPVITDHLIAPATDGQLKPWFSQVNGSDAVVDANGQLHIVCTIDAGASNDDDSLGFTWNLNSQLVGQFAQHFIYDVHTTATGWDAWLVDSLMATPGPGANFSDGTSAFDTDARIQASITADGQKIFYTWSDSDVLISGGENSFCDLFARGVNLTTGLWTARTQFTTTADFFWNYTSDIALASGNTYTIPVTNSIGRSSGTDMISTFDHYYLNNVQFQDADFNLAIGVEEVAAFGSYNLYPNPANEVVNVNLDLNNAGNVRFTIYNQLGQEVMVENRDLAAGNTLVQLNTEALTSGIYFLNIAVGNNSTSSKLIIK